MVTFAAPYPAIQQQVALPNPQLNDSFNGTGEIDIQRMMDGTRYTYSLPKNGKQRLLLDLRLSRMKWLELEQFITAWHSRVIQYTDQLGQAWRMNFTSNPVEFRTTVRALNSPGREMGTVQVELEGFKINA